MTRSASSLAVLCAGLALIAGACAGAGGGREVSVTATNDGCSPTSVDAAAGEKLTFVVVNRAGGDREFEGIEGTRLEEVLIPSGKTRKLNYTVPAEGGIHKVKCYIPGGPSTIIEVRAPEGRAAAIGSTVEVELTEWSVKPSVAEVKAGRVRFVVRNKGALVHELAVVEPKKNGDPEEVPGAEVEDISPGATVEFVADLTAGTYELACLIEKGEFNSEVDHYDQGMKVAFRVR